MSSPNFSRWANQGVKGPAYDAFVSFAVKEGKDVGTKEKTLKLLKEFLETDRDELTPDGLRTISKLCNELEESSSTQKTQSVFKGFMGQKKSDKLLREVKADTQQLFSERGVRELPKNQDKQSLLNICNELGKEKGVDEAKELIKSGDLRSGYHLLCEHLLAKSETDLLNKPFSAMLRNELMKSE